MYLLDTNIWLERLLDQERSEEVGQFLSQIPPDDMAITDFTLHSIGVILNRLGQETVLLQFVGDLLIDNHVYLATVPPDNFWRIVNIISQFNLDFDDAYQYVAAEQLNAVIVSFDSDFNRTGRNKQTPSDIINP